MTPIGYVMFSVTLIAMLLIVFVNRKIKCKDCGNNMETTGISGDKYLQYHCKKCDRKIFLKYSDTKDI